MHGDNSTDPLAINSRTVSADEVSQYSIVYLIQYNTPTSMDFFCTDAILVKAALCGRPARGQISSPAGV